MFFSLLLAIFVNFSSSVCCCLILRSTKTYVRIWWITDVWNYLRKDGDFFSLLLLSTKEWWKRDGFLLPGNCYLLLLYSQLFRFISFVSCLCFEFNKIKKNLHCMNIRISIICHVKEWLALFSCNICSLECPGYQVYNVNTS